MTGWTRRTVLGGALSALAGCVVPDQPPVPGEGIDASRFGGIWYQAATVSTEPQPAVRPQIDKLFETKALGGRERSTGNGTIIGDDWQELFEAANTGKLYFAGPVPKQWVLWVDSGYRTALIGQLDGNRARIVSRTQEVPEKDLIAARSVANYFGYDMTKLDGATQ
ncbi:lipocalin family protein [Chachezhania sediminis]|uniref:lipocalin family protein n=1 Tax=Chachezhania sediminis TaxID=2599291 RepID=UPI00131D780A|nr:lipocalin family protein [Chachezhania sediminis]